VEDAEGEGLVRLRSSSKKFFNRCMGTAPPLDIGEIIPLPFPVWEDRIPESADISPGIWIVSLVGMPTRKECGPSNSSSPRSSSWDEED
jgi:hypothetical protein